MSSWKRAAFHAHFCVRCGFAVQDPIRGLIAMDDRLAALRADRNRLCQELSITRRVIHTASRKAKRIRRATSHAWCLLPLMLDTMLTIYVLAGYTPEPAVVYLQQCGRRRRWAQRSEDALARMVEDHFLQCDDERLASLTDVREPLDETILDNARAMCKNGSS